MNQRAGKSGVRGFFEDGETPWESRYAGNDAEAATYRDRAGAALEFAANYLPEGADILEVGCGMGHLSRAFEDAGFNVTSCDIALRMAQQARDRMDAGATLVADIERPPFREGIFDAVVLIGVISYVEDADLALNNIHRLLKRDGILIISSANRNLLLHGVSRRLSRLFARRPIEKTANRRDGRRSKFFRDTCTYYKASAFNELVIGSGYRKMASRNIGFGRLRLPQPIALREAQQVGISRSLSALSRYRPFRWLGDFAFANVACFRRES